MLSRPYGDTWVRSVGCREVNRVRIKSIRRATSDEWDRVWQACGYATYFHSREWAEIIRAYTDGHTQPEPVSVIFSDGKTALLPLSAGLAASGRRDYVSSPCGTYGGWISESSLGADHAVLLHDLLTSEQIVWRLNPYDTVAQTALAGLGEPDETQALRLCDGFESIYRHWSYDHKKAERQARRNGVQVRMAAGIEDWRAYYGVYQDCLRRWADGATSSYGWELFDQIRRLSSPWVALWLATYDGAVVSGILAFHTKSHVVAWHGATFEHCFHLRPANLIYSEFIRDSCERGYLWADLNPSGGHEGVKVFKQRFGATPLPCAVIRTEPRTPELVGRIAEFKRRVKRRVLPWVHWLR